MNCEVGYRTSCPEIVTGNRRDFDGWYKNGLLFPNALCLTTTKKLMIYAWCHQFTNAHIKKWAITSNREALVLGNHTWTLKLTSHSVTRGSHILRSCNPMAAIQHVSESELKSHWYGSAMLPCEFLSTWTFNISKEQSNTSRVWNRWLDNNYSLHFWANLWRSFACVSLLDMGLSLTSR